MTKNFKDSYVINHKINYKMLEEPVNQLKVLAHPVRFAIVIILSSNRKMTVTDIFEELSLQQAATSNHLKLMKTINILNSHRVGKNTYYSVNKEAMTRLYSVLKLYDPEVN